MKHFFKNVYFYRIKGGFKPVGTQDSPCGGEKERTCAGGLPGLVRLSGSRDLGVVFPLRASTARVALPRTQQSTGDLRVFQERLMEGDVQRGGQG